MDNVQVNAYSNSSASSSSSSASGTASLDTTEFMKLLATQLSNQDMMNPMQDTEFISQMAQFTSLQNSENLYNSSTQQLQAIQDLTELSYMQYGAELIGKTVEVASIDSDGSLQKHQGVVSSVNFSTSTYSLTIDGKQYPISSVMQVIAPSQS